MPRPPKPSAFRPAKSSVGGGGGVRATARCPTVKGVVERPVFPPLDRAIVKAIACETVAKTGQPLSRQSLADLTRRINESFRVPMSRSMVWRTLHEEAIKPWQHEHWIFPRDPRFAEKAGPILDLYAG